jgi:predicted TIM-barrel fold metal-dependent hydrolase/predicted NBD/HSP70 family sugar kinase
MQRVEECRTLAVDIGGTGIKLALLDGAGNMIGERVRVPTPTPPVGPELVTETIGQAAAALGDFDRASVGFPGMVRHGRVLTAPHLGTEAWAGYDLQTELSRRWGKPVRVMNDADVQGFGAIRGVGVEMVVTLGTGCGTAIFDDGKVIPHLELSHHPVRKGRTYDQYVGRAALEEIGKKKWNRRIARIIDVLRTVVAFDHLYIGGGNAKRVKLDLPEDVTIVPNRFGLTGGFALWRDIDAARLAKDASLPGYDRTATASKPRTAVGFQVPEDACDCHVHVFGTAAQFPFATTRGYTPPPASVDELAALLRALRLSRVVIVQPSIYGTDNSCTLDGMRRLGPDRARGVAVIGETTSEAELDAMHRAGIRGVRVNLETAGESDPDRARRLLADAAARIAGRGWHIQVYTRLAVIAALSEQVASLTAPVVFDHFGGAQAAGGVGQPGFSALLDLVRAGHAYVKVSAAYRSSNAAPAYADVAPLARALIDANPERIVWGSDWPHPHAAAPGAAAGAGLAEPTPFYDIDDGLALNQLADWAPDAATRRKVLVENPARLYDF